MQALLTLVHVSDLHFSDLHFGDPPPKTPAWWEQGRAGHLEAAYNALYTFCTNLPLTPRRMLVCTGDLTASGQPEQYKRAREALEDLAAILDDGDCLTQRVITGNHDAWPTPYSLIPPDLHAIHKRNPLSTSPESPYGPTPRWGEVLHVGSEEQPVAIRFAVLDSDAETWESEDPTLSSMTSALLARGNFETQVDKLLNIIREKDDNKAAINVLLLHHSPSYKYDWGRAAGSLHFMTTVFGDKIDHNFAPLVIAPQSASRLKELLDHGGISVVLSGHTHNACITALNDLSDYAGVNTVEACCGTSLQRDTQLDSSQFREEVYYYLKQRCPILAEVLRSRLLDHLSAKQKVNVVRQVLVHELQLDHSALLWQVKIYEHDGEQFSLQDVSAFGVEQRHQTVIL
jgi:predicted phosphodiesterase